MHDFYFTDPIAWTVYYYSHSLDGASRYGHRVVKSFPLGYLHRFPGDFERRGRRKRRGEAEEKPEVEKDWASCREIGVHVLRVETLWGGNGGFKFPLIPRRRISNLRSSGGNPLVTFGAFVNGRTERSRKRERERERERERASVTRQRSIS